MFFPPFQCCDEPRKNGVNPDGLPTAVYFQFGTAVSYCRFTPTNNRAATSRGATRGTGLTFTTHPIYASLQKSLSTVSNG